MARMSGSRATASLFVILLVFCSGALSSASASGADVGSDHYETTGQHVLHPKNPSGPMKKPPVSTLPVTSSANPYSTSSVLQDLRSAISVLSASYFAIWLGKWTTAIDWTAAVTNTHLTSVLSTLSTVSREHEVATSPTIENEINKYFSQSIAYYFGEDHFAIRMQAYDDMLWVVLGWLDSVRFINSRSNHHGPDADWHGKQFIPAFAHRARVFYELAEQGWDWRLCGGGMTWNPRLLPYKNAITNQLFIAASVSMYLDFPGDSNCSPFLGVQDATKYGRPGSITDQDLFDCDTDTDGKPRYDPVYLANAIHGYDWLSNVGMMNDRGLYVDGFHIKGYASNHSKTTCDERNDMLYTYNQGVLLSGLRGLWVGTGNTSYLEDGHTLIRNVIRATGWTDADIKSMTTADVQRDWSGLGANGILTELCDPLGSCNQDGQTFKGIFFHHLTAFCAPLPIRPVQPGKTYAASPEQRALHRQSCSEYMPWVVHNGRAALATRNEEGHFGAWWGASILSSGTPSETSNENFETGLESLKLLPEGAVDYRNDDLRRSVPKGESVSFDINKDSRRRERQRGFDAGKGDLNDRGLGRTVETQGAGVAVVRAMWEFLRLREEDL